MAILRSAPPWARPADVFDLIRLALPIAISRAAIMLLSLTDVIVLSHHAEMQVPFLLNGWLLISLALAVGMGILQGVQVFTAELSGVGEYRNTGRVFRRGILVGGVLGVIFTVLIYVTASPIYHGLGFEDEVADKTALVARILSLGLVGHMLTSGCSLYLEALRRPTLVAVIMYAGVLVNLVLNLLLVAGWGGLPKLGVEGVAWATTGTRIFLTIIFIAIVAWLTPAFRKSDPAPKDEFWRQNSVGAGGAIANIAEFGGFNFTFVIATWASLTAATLYGLWVQTLFFSFMIFLGVGTATSVRVAEAFGRGDAQGVRDAGRLGVVTGLFVGVTLSLLLYVFRPLVAAILVQSDPEVSDFDLYPELISLLVLAAMVLTFDGMQGLAAMALRAQEIVWPPAVIQIGSYFVILLPAAYILGVVMGRGAQGIAEAVIVSSLFAATSQVFWLEWKGGRIAPTSHD